MTTIDVVEPGTGAISRQELPMAGTACDVALQAMPGASHLQVRLREDDKVVLFAEIECGHRESAEVHIERHADGRYSLESGLRNVYFLPANLEPKESILKPVATGDLEVVLLIDATALDLQPDDRGKSAIGTMLQPGGQPSPQWTALARKLTEFVEELQRNCGGGLRASVLAFGDYPMPISPDSIAIYPSGPMQRQLHAQSPEQVFEQLTRLPRISGGDYVDALADALDVCAGRGLNWSDRTRKLLVILGNSPGYSVLDADLPALERADSQTRVYDVYQEAMDLHAIGVEIMTIFHDSGIDVMSQLSAAAAALLDHTRQQYVRLATRPEWAFTSSGFKPHPAARDWSATKSASGRGPCPGIWVTQS